MTDKHVLILDYSKENVEADIIKSWMPADFKVTTMSVESEDVFTDELLAKGFSHVIHSGSELMVHDVAPRAQKLHRYMQALSEAGVPQYGICFGHQALCASFGGLDTIRCNPNGPELGWMDITFTDHAKEIFAVGDVEVQFQHHTDEATQIPPGAQLLATNAHTPVQGFIHYEHKIMGTQFHPEMNKEVGNEIFLEYRKMFEKHNLNVDEVVTQGPSTEASRAIFDYFLRW